MVRWKYTMHALPGKQGGGEGGGGNQGQRPLIYNQLIKSTFQWIVIFGSKSLSGKWLFINDVITQGAGGCR